MQITITDRPPIQQVRHILEDCPQALLHSTPEFTQALAYGVEGTPRWILAVEGERAVGVLPFFELASPRWGTVINSYPFFGAHGGCLVHGDAQHVAVRQGLLSEFFQYVHSRERLISASISVSFLEYEYIEIYRDTLRPDAEDARIAQICTLPNHDICQSVMAQHSTPRAIRKSLRQNFSLTIDDSDQAWDFLHTMQEKNMSEKGMRPKTRQQTIAFRTCLRADQRVLHVAKLEGNLVAALLVFLHKPWVHYAIPVYEASIASKQPMTALIYTAMCAYAAAGYRFWSFGGTPLGNISLHRFKAHWGAEDKPYCYVTTASPYGKKLFSQYSAELLEDFQNYYVYPLGQH